MEAQRGTSLIEVLLTVAILAMLWTVASLTLGNRPFEMRSAATMFDAQLAHAQTIASSTAGGAATLSFAIGPAGSGTMVSVSPADAPPETLRADVSEATLGKPPFAITVDPYGHAVSPEPCPSGGYALTFSAGPASEERVLPCALTVAGPPEPVGTVPP